MLPGDVYYYSANSCVLCVKRGQLKKVQKPGTGLNPYADAFFSSKSLTPAEKSWEPSEGQEYLTNGDLSLQDEVGGGFSSGDSPVSDSPPAPIMDGVLEAGAPPPEFVPDPMVGTLAPAMPLVLGTETESGGVGGEEVVGESLELAVETVPPPADMAAIATAPVTVPNGLDGGSADLRSSAEMGKSARNPREDASLPGADQSAEEDVGDREELASSPIYQAADGQQLSSSLIDQAAEDIGDREELSSSPIDQAAEDIGDREELSSSPIDQAEEDIGDREELSSSPIDQAAEDISDREELSSSPTDQAEEDIGDREELSSSPIDQAEEDIGDREELSSSPIDRAAEDIGDREELSSSPIDQAAVGQKLSSSPKNQAAEDIGDREELSSSPIDQAAVGQKLSSSPKNQAAEDIGDREELSSSPIDQAEEDIGDREELSSSPIDQTEEDIGDREELSSSPIDQAEKDIGDREELSSSPIDRAAEDIGDREELSSSPIDQAAVGQKLSSSPKNQAAEDIGDREELSSSPIDQAAVGQQLSSSPIDQAAEDIGDREELSSPPIDQAEEDIGDREELSSSPTDQAEEDIGDREELSSSPIDQAEEDIGDREELSSSPIDQAAEDTGDDEEKLSSSNIDDEAEEDIADYYSCDHDWAEQSSSLIDQAADGQELSTSPIDQAAEGGNLQKSSTEAGSAQNAFASGADQSVVSHSAEQNIGEGQELPSCSPVDQSAEGESVDLSSAKVRESTMNPLADTFVPRVYQSTENVDVDDGQELSSSPIDQAAEDIGDREELSSSPTDQAEEDIGDREELSSSPTDQAEEDIGDREELSSSPIDQAEEDIGDREELSSSPIDQAAEDTSDDEGKLSSSNIDKEAEEDIGDYYSCDHDWAEQSSSLIDQAADGQELSTSPIDQAAEGGNLQKSSTEAGSAQNAFASGTDQSDVSQSAEQNIGEGQELPSCSPVDQSAEGESVDLSSAKVRESTMNPSADTFVPRVYQSAEDVDVDDGQELSSSPINQSAEGERADVSFAEAEESALNPEEDDFMYGAFQSGGQGFGNGHWNPPVFFNFPSPFPMFIPADRLKWTSGSPGQLHQSDFGRAALPTGPSVDGFDLVPGPGQPNQGTAEGAASSGSQASEASSLELAPADLRRQLQVQLEYYFSRDNLVQDHYLQSQMDGDQYVPIITIANFNQVLKLTTDVELIVDVLKNSKAVQVDDTGTKVRPRHNRTVLMLREIPENTPTAEVEELFQHEKCPKLQHCEFAHNGYWYVTFNTDEDCASAFCFLRERNIMFRNKPVLARIKARPLVRSGGGNPYPSKAASQPQQDQAVPYLRQQQAQFPIMAAPMPQFQQQVPQAVAPFHLYNLQTMMPQWPNTAAHTFLDPGAMLTMNGLQATAVKPSTNHSRNMYHHPVRSNNNRGMGKPHHRPQSLSTDKVPEPRALDRPHANHLPSTRTSPRTNPGHPHPPDLLSQPPPFGRSRSEGSSSAGNAAAAAGHFNSTPSAAPTPLLPEDSLPSHMPAPLPSTKGDSASSNVQHKRGNYRKSRRNEDGAKNSRMNTSHSGKEGKPHEPHFELEPRDFPSLRHGSSDNSSSGSAPEGSKLSDKLSDVVKGTTRPNTSRLEDKVKASSTPAPAVVTTATVSTPGQATPTDTATDTAPAATSTAAATTTLTASTPAVAKDTEATATAANGNHTAHVHASTSATAVESSAHTSKTSKTSSQHTSSPPGAKSWEPSLTSKQATASTTPARTASAPSPVVVDAAPARLSYAQVARKQQQAEGASKPSREEGGAQHAPVPAASAQTTLREQSQTQASASVSASPAPTKSASASANARPPSKEGPRKDFDPKEPRFPGGRGAKENRNGRQPRFDRRRTDRDVKVPAK
ncbi:hypothetical protein ACOMHN_000226 [Nucella lapillus]